MKLQLLRRLVALLERVHPAWTGALAETLFITPPRHAPSAREREGLRSFASLKIPFPGGELQAHRRGEGPLVLLIHGWGGRGGQMRAFATALAEAGFCAVALDAPAHGGRPGRRASIPQFAAALKAAEAHLGPVHGVIGHSLGGISTLAALADGLSARRAVVVAAPARPRRFYRQLLAHLGVSEPRCRELEAAFERRIGRRWEDVEAPALVRDLDVPILLIHDQEDREVPLEEAEATLAAARAGRLLATRGLGHRRILKDPGVVHAAVRFLGGEPCSAEKLEAELACPDLRA